MVQANEPEVAAVVPCQQVGLEVDDVPWVVESPAVRTVIPALLRADEEGRGPWESPTLYLEILCPAQVHQLVLVQSQENSEQVLEEFL